MAKYFVIALDDASGPTMSVDDDGNGQMFTMQADAERRANFLASDTPGTMYAVASASHAASCEVKAPKMVEI